jgi:hypothetical protein
MRHTPVSHRALQVRLRGKLHREVDKYSDPTPLMVHAVESASRNARGLKGARIYFDHMSPRMFTYLDRLLPHQGYGTFTDAVIEGSLVFEATSKFEQGSLKPQPGRPNIYIRARKVTLVRPRKSSSGTAD